MSTVIDERIVGANLERTVLHRDGSVTYIRLNDNSDGWVTHGSLPALYGRLRYRKQLRSMR